MNNLGFYVLIIKVLCVNILGEHSIISWEFEFKELSSNFVSKLQGNCATTSKLDCQLPEETQGKLVLGTSGHMSRCSHGVLPCRHD